MRIPVLLLLLACSAARAEAVRVPGPEGIMLNAELFPAQGKLARPAVVALHGCGGPLATRDEAWARQLAAAGHTVVLPDSFGSRGLGSQCTSRSHPVTAAGVRRRDTLAVLAWLAARPGTPPGGLVLVGWADGGSTVLAAGRMMADLPPNLVRGLVAFYPSCRGPAEAKDWTPAAPLLILMADADESAAVAACRALAERLPGKVTLLTHPGSNRDFDVPTPKPPVRGRLATRIGTAPAADPGAREESVRRVLAFIAGLP